MTGYGPTPEDRLREALLARADEVEPSPGALPKIRMRTARGRRTNVWAMIGAAAAVATAIAAGAVVVSDRRGDQDRPGVVPTSAQRPEKSGTPPPASPSAGPTAKTLPVYFARNGRLYREFRPVQLADDSDTGKIRKAVEMSLQGDAADPDYRTLWPGGVTVDAVSIADGRVTVQLRGAGGRAPSDLAAQQLVYTVSATATYTSMQHTDGVRLLVDGAGGVLRQAPMADVQAPVWVIEPDEGAVVGKTFTVYLAGIVWEGTVTLRIRGTGGDLVYERVVRLSAGAPALGEARVPVTLGSGRYTVEAFFVSAQDRSVQWVDDHDFTVG